MPSLPEGVEASAAPPQAFVQGSLSTDQFMPGDPEVRMREDPVRILRAVRFSGKLGLDIESRTYAAMGKRLLRQWVGKPLLDVAQIAMRQEGVAYFHEDGLLRAGLRAAVREVDHVIAEHRSAPSRARRARRWWPWRC